MSLSYNSTITIPPAIQYVFSGGILPTLVLNTIILVSVLTTFLLCCRFLPLYNVTKKQHMLAEYSRQLDAKLRSSSVGVMPDESLSCEPKQSAVARLKSQLRDYRAYWTAGLAQLWHCTKTLLIPWYSRRDRIDLFRRFGRDVASFVLFQQCMIAALFVCSLLSLAVLFPLYATGKMPPDLQPISNATSALNRNDEAIVVVTVSMIQADAARLAGTLVLGLIFMLIFLSSLGAFFSNPIVSTYNYLGHDADLSIQDNISLDLGRQGVTHRARLIKLSQMKHQLNDEWIGDAIVNPQMRSKGPVLMNPFTLELSGLPVSITSSEVFRRIVLSSVPSEDRRYFIDAKIVIDCTKRIQLDKRLRDLDAQLHHERFIYMCVNEGEKRPQKTFFLRRFEGQFVFHKRVDAIEYLERQKRIVKGRISEWNRNYYTAMHAHLEMQPDGRTLVVRQGNEEEAEQAIASIERSNLDMISSESEEDENVLDSRDLRPDEHTHISPRELHHTPETEEIARDESNDYEQQMIEKMENVRIRGTGFGYVTFSDEDALWRFAMRAKIGNVTFNFGRGRRGPQTRRKVQREQQGMHEIDTVIELPTVSNLGAVVACSARAAGAANSNASGRSSRVATQLVQRSLQFVTLRTRLVDYEPQDVNWNNVMNYYKLSAFEPALRQFFITIALIIFLFFFSTPAALLSALQQFLRLQFIGQGVDIVKVITGPLGGLFFQYLPTLVLLLFVNIVPLAVIQLTKASNYITHGYTKREVSTRYYAYVVITTLLLPGLLLTSIDGILAYLTSQHQFEQAIANLFTPATAAFFINYVLQQALLGSLGNFLSVGDFIVWCWKMRLGLGTRKMSLRERIEAAELSPTEMHLEYASMISTLAVIVVYSAFAPVILLAGLLWLLGRYTVTRFNLQSLLEYKAKVFIDLDSAQQVGAANESAVAAGAPTLAAADFGRRVRGHKVDYASHIKLMLLVLELSLSNLVMFGLFMCFFFGLRTALSTVFIAHTVVAAVATFNVLLLSLAITIVRRLFSRVLIKRLANVQSHGGIDAKDSVVQHAYEPPFGWAQRLHYSNNGNSGGDGHNEKKALDEEISIV